MLHLLDESLEAFLRAEVRLLREVDVDVSFEAPDKDWGAGVSKPTINLYLWDVRRNADAQHAGMQVTAEDGRMVRQPAAAQIDCRYLVTAWTTAVRDQHDLLGQVVAAVLRAGHLAEQYLRGPYASVRPLPRLSVAAQDASNKSDLWSALGGQLKAGLDLVVTTPTVDAALAVDAGPPVERYTVATGDRVAYEPRSRSLTVGGIAPGANGALVRSPRGHSTVRPDDHFAIRVKPGDEVTVEADRHRSAKVPTTGPVWVDE